MRNMTNWWQQLRSRFGRKAPVIPVVIDGTAYSVTESMRWQAARNMAADPALRAKIVEMIGEAEARRRYPEAYAG